MRTLSALVAALFLVCGGTIALVCLLAGQAIAFGLIFGTLIASGSIPFIRAVRRMSARPEDRRPLRYERVNRNLVMYIAVALISVGLMPAPVGVRVILGFFSLVAISIGVLARRDSSKS